MRIALLGVAHWHTFLYVDPDSDDPGFEVVGVSDPLKDAADACAARFGCRTSTDFRELCLATRPDFVLALGRHCDMAEAARFLIEQRIPFAMEKPAGLDHAEVADLAARAEAAGVFAAIPFVFRYTGLLRAIREIAAGETVHYAGFRFIAGPPSRYLEAGCGWMLDPARSGGGSGINLGCHFLDLCRVLMPGTAPEVVASLASNSAEGLAIEDHSLIAVSSEGRVGLVETGYLYPAPVGVFDMHFSIRAESHYFIARGPGVVEVSDMRGTRRELSLTTTNMPHYPTFVADTLRRLQAGEPPIADLRDMEAVMAMLDAAYRRSAVRRPRVA